MSVNRADTNFEYALKHTLEHEGVFSDYSWDPGGRTKYGITERVWNAFQRESSYPETDIGKITPEMARTVYKVEYWIAPGFYLVDDKYIAAELFDTGVNCGTVRAIQMCQEAVNVLRKDGWDAIAVDGKLGPVTRQAIQRLVHQGYRLNLLRAMNGEQYCYYKKIDNRNAARGWMKRLSVALAEEKDDDHQ